VHPSTAVFRCAAPFTAAPRSRPTAARRAPSHPHTLRSARPLCPLASPRPSLEPARAGTTPLHAALAARLVRARPLTFWDNMLDAGDLAPRRMPQPPAARPAAPLPPPGHEHRPEPRPRPPNAHPRLRGRYGVPRAQARPGRAPGSKRVPRGLAAAASRRRSRAWFHAPVLATPPLVHTPDARWSAARSRRARAHARERAQLPAPPPGGANDATHLASAVARPRRARRPGSGPPEIPRRLHATLATRTSDLPRHAIAWRLASLLDSRALSRTDSRARSARCRRRLRASRRRCSQTRPQRRVRGLPLGHALHTPRAPPHHHPPACVDDHPARTISSRLYTAPAHECAPVERQHAHGESSLCTHPHGRMEPATHLAGHHTMPSPATWRRHVPRSSWPAPTIRDLSRSPHMR
jgi:hypothetical protein